MANNHEEEGWKQMQLSLKWNLEFKLDSNIYLDFDVIFEVFFMIFLE